MGSQVDRATNIILALEEKVRRTLPLGNSQKKKKVQTLPSGRIFFRFRLKGITR
jgi:hypothetical protein